MNEQQEKDAILIKNNFADNDELLMNMRSLLLGREIPQKVKDQIAEMFKNEDLVRIVKNTIFQEISDNPPLGQMNDFWMGADRIAGATREVVYQTIVSRVRVLKMFKKIPEILRNPEIKIDLNYEPSEITLMTEDVGCDLLARNLYVRTVDVGMYMLKLVAGKKAETPEEQKKRLEQNSNK